MKHIKEYPIPHSSGSGVEPTYWLKLTLLGLPILPNQRMHWSRRAFHNKNWRYAVQMMSLKYRPTEPIKRVELTFTRGSIRACDPDNLISSFKPLLDGLQDAGVLENDSFQNIQSITPKFVKVEDRKNAFVSIYLIEVV